VDFTIVNHQVIASAVVCLLLYANPSAIVRRIRPVWVYSIYGVLPLGAWLFSHVCQEILETVTPSFTNSDTAPAVEAIDSALWVAAPLAQ
jgi:hypothetical protein